VIYKPYRSLRKNLHPTFEKEIHGPFPTANVDWNVIEIKNQNLFIIL
jgi:hypothetical protein